MQLRIKYIFFIVFFACKLSAITTGSPVSQSQTNNDDHEIYKLFQQFEKDLQSSKFQRAKERDLAIKRTVAQVSPYVAAVATNVSQEVWYHGLDIPRSHLAHATFDPIIFGAITHGSLLALKKANIAITCPKKIENLGPNSCAYAALISQMAFSLAVSKLVVGPTITVMFGVPHSN